MNPLTMIGMTFLWGESKSRSFECLDWPEEYACVEALRQCASDLADRFSLDRPDGVRIWSKGTDFGRTIYCGPPTI